MASTIKLKTGTGSAVPSALAQGEVGINIDNGLIYYGSGSGNSVKQLESFTNITASGGVDIQGTLSLPGFSDVSASLAGAVAGGDNLGNHTATQDLNMGGNNITSVGNVDGVDVSALNTSVSTNTTNITTLTAATSSYLTSVPDGTLSGSAQIATEISGAFTAASASFSTRVTANDAKVGYTDAAVTSVINTAGVISSSAQLDFVDTSGTPVDNQISVFTDSDTIEGSSKLVFINDNVTGFSVRSTNSDSHAVTIVGGVGGAIHPKFGPSGSHTTLKMGLDTSNDIFDFQNNKIAFDADSTNTFIQADTSNPENLEIHADGNIELRADDNLEIHGPISTPITASGDISASGTIIAATLDAAAVSDTLAAAIVAEIDNDEIPIAKLAEDAVTVTAGTGLSGGGSVTLGGSITINSDGLLSSSAQIATDISGAFTATSAALAADIASAGDITGVTAGSGLSGGGSSGAVTVNVDYGSGTIITDAGAFNTGGTSVTNDLLLVHHNDDGEAQKVGITAFMDEYKIVNRTGTPVDNDYAKFTDANTIEGRSFSEVKTDLSLGNVTNESKATMFTSPTFTGNVTASGNISASGDLEFENRLFNESHATLGSNGAIGDIIKFGNTSTTAGGVYYLNSSGGWSLAQSNAVGTATSSLAVALGSNSTTNGMCLRGFVNPYGLGDGQGIGMPVYLHNGFAGRFRGIAPTGSGEIVRILGHQYGSDLIYFNPSNDYIVLS